MNRLSEDIVKRLGALRFDHKRLVAYQVALEALLRGEALLDDVPRGHSSLVDQTRRALEGAYLNTCEVAAADAADLRGEATRVASPRRKKVSPRGSSKRRPRGRNGNTGVTTKVSAMS